MGEGGRGRGKEGIREEGRKQGLGEGKGVENREGGRVQDATVGFPNSK